VITHGDLSAYCEANLTSPLALRLCQAFGALSPLVLKPEVLQLANALDDSMPQLTTVPPGVRERPGGCIVVLYSSSYHEIIKKAIVLPMVWSIADDHASGLPVKLRTVATQVIETLAGKMPFETADPRQWRLQFDPGYVSKALVLSDDLFETFDSAFITLSAGLVAAIQGLQPDYHTWGSAGWSEHQGLVRVAGLCEKIQTAIELGATHFFLPLWQLDEVSKECPSLEKEIALQGLASSTQRDVLKTIEPMLAAFTKQPMPPSSPDDSEGLNRCVSYYFNQVAKSESQKQFYKTHLFPTIVARCRQRIAAKLQESRPTHLVTIASGEKEVTMIAILSSGVDHCLLLHTDDPKQTALAEQIKNELKNDQESLLRFRLKVPEIELRGFCMGGQLVAGLRDATTQFVSTVDPDQLVYDIKPGTKRMTFSIAQLVRSGNWIYDFAQTFNKNLPVPGTELPEMWQVSHDITAMANGH